MQRIRMTFSMISLFVVLLLALSACSGQAAQVSSLTFVPPDVEIAEIVESDIANSQITQRKTFNQCESASPFEAQVQFSDSSSQANQQELVLKGGASGEAGITALAKIKIEGAVEQHFASSIDVGRGHQEAVTIKVPAHTQQEYTIVWRESRRQGKVKYAENGETKSVDFSYRVGLELMSASGRDLPCPLQQGVQTKAVPASATPPQPLPTSTPVILVVTATPSPTNPPTLTPETTSASSVLEIGETWQENNRQLTLIEVTYNREIPSVILSFDIKNISNDTIAFGYDRTNFSVKANTGVVFSCRWDDCGDTKIIEPGKASHVTSAWRGSHMEFYGNYFDPKVTELIVTVNNLSGIPKARWRIPIAH